MNTTTEQVVDWRAELRDLLGEENAYAFDFVEAVAVDHSGGDPNAAMAAAGLTIELLADACRVLSATFGEWLRRARDLKPYVNLTLPGRRAVDTAPVRLREAPRGLQLAMVRHVDLLPELEGMAVADLFRRGWEPPNRELN